MRGLVCDIGSPTHHTVILVRSLGIPTVVGLGGATEMLGPGQTLALVKGFCAGQVGEVRTAVLYEKPRSIVACDYVWRRTDLWVVFPWSAQPPVSP